MKKILLALGEIAALLRSVIKLFKKSPLEIEDLNSKKALEHVNKQIKKAKRRKP